MSKIVIFERLILNYKPLSLKFTVMDCYIASNRIISRTTQVIEQTESSVM